MSLDWVTSIISICERMRMIYFLFLLFSIGQIALHSYKCVCTYRVLYYQNGMWYICRNVAAKWENAWENAKQIYKTHTHTRIHRQMYKNLENVVFRKCGWTFTFLVRIRVHIQMKTTSWMFMRLFTIALSYSIKPNTLDPISLGMYY